ncbi:MAG: cation acetate symporter [Actinomycetota bacterium]
MSDPRSLLAALGLIAVMLAVSWAVRRSTFTTLDFYLARRQVGPFLNACAICGDYFSAASFLGVAGVVYAAGADGIWFATGFAAGFVVLLFFLAAPFRRARQFSIPDFLASRFNSAPVRLTAVAIVQVIVLLYLIPQLAGAGLIWEVFIGRGLGSLSPYTTGIALCTVAIVLQAVVGGMKGTTWNQALQFGLKLFTVIVLGLVVMAAGFSYPSAADRVSRGPLTVPTEVARGRLVTPAGEATPLLEQARRVMSQPGFDRVRSDLAAGSPRVDVLLPADNRLHPGDSLRFVEPGFRFTAPEQIALIITLLLGTAGLPHITHRYFTASSGRAARASTVWVLALAAAFYFLAVLLGVAARSELPRHMPPGVTNGDFVDGVVRVPEKALLLLADRTGGEPLLTLVSAAAFAAVFSTVAGLLIAAATTWGRDVYEEYINPEASEARRVRFARIAVTLTAIVAAAIALGISVFGGAQAPGVALMVTWAFAVAGSAFTPVFLLAVWWRRTTTAGALAGMIIGAVLSVSAIVVALVAERAGWTGWVELGHFPSFLAAPSAALGVVAVSLRNPAPESSAAWWVRLHGTAPERRQALLIRLAAREGEAP